MKKPPVFRGYVSFKQGRPCCFWFKSSKRNGELSHVLGIMEISSFTIPYSINGWNVPSATIHPPRLTWHLKNHPMEKAIPIGSLQTSRFSCSFSGRFQLVAAYQSPILERLVTPWVFAGADLWDVGLRYEAGGYDPSCRPRGGVDWMISLVIWCDSYMAKQHRFVADLFIPCLLMFACSNSRYFCVKKPDSKTTESHGPGAKDIIKRQDQYCWVTWLVVWYRGWQTTQLYGDCNKPL